MAASRREQILQAILTTLNTGAPGGVPAFTRSRTREVEVASLPQGALAPISEEVTKEGGRWNTVAVRTMEFAVDYWNQPADAATDDGVQWITKALVGQKLGGLAHVIEELGTRWEFQGGNPPACRATVTLRVRYQSHEADQEATG